MHEVGTDALHAEHDGRLVDVVPAHGHRAEADIGDDGPHLLGVAVPAALLEIDLAAVGDFAGGPVAAGRIGERRLLGPRGLDPGHDPRHHRRGEEHGDE